MSFDASPTLRYLARQIESILCSCEDCRRIGTVLLVDLIAQYGEATQLGTIKRRFRCSACGSPNVDARPAWRDRLQ